jgi:hypothetical protein
MFMRSVRILHYCIWLLPLLLFIFLFSRFFVFSGELSFVYDMKKESPYVSLVPTQRISEPKAIESGFTRTVLSEPLYLDVRTPRPFERAYVTMRYRNHSQHTIELAGVVNRGKGHFVFHPVESIRLENLEWPKVSENGITLWQREKRYDTVASFVQNLPSSEEIVVYDYELGQGYDTFSPLVDIESTPKNYLIARYTPSVNNSEAREKTVEFDLKQLEYGYHKYRFIVSAPDVSKEKGFEMEKISFLFKREPLTIKNFYSRVRKYFDAHF